jgi:hypothetical protein
MGVRVGSVTGVGLGMEVGVGVKVGIWAGVGDGVGRGAHAVRSNVTISKQRVNIALPGLRRLD